jgi:hypothetical protein
LYHLHNPVGEQDGEAPAFIQFVFISILDNSELAIGQRRLLLPKYLIAAFVIGGISAVPLGFWLHSFWVPPGLRLSARLCYYSPSTRKS